MPTYLSDDHEHQHRTYRSAEGNRGVLNDEGLHPLEQTHELGAAAFPQERIGASREETIQVQANVAHGKPVATEPTQKQLWDSSMPAVWLLATDAY